jgi:hypothetical protein
MCGTPLEHVLSLAAHEGEHTLVQNRFAVGGRKGNRFSIDGEGRLAKIEAVLIAEKSRNEGKAQGRLEVGRIRGQSSWTSSNPRIGAEAKE